MLRSFYIAVPLLALCLSVSLAAQAQQPPMPPKPMGAAGMPSGSVVPPAGQMPGGMGMAHGPSGSFPNGIPQDGPRAGLPPMGLPDGHRLPMPRVRPQYMPGNAMPAAPRSPGGGQ